MFNKKTILTFTMCVTLILGISLREDSYAVADTTSPSGDGVSCTTSNHLYDSYSTQNGQRQAQCAKCSSVGTGVDVFDSQGVKIGVNYKRTITTVYATVRDCKSSNNVHDSCNEISINGGVTGCPDIFVPTAPDTTTP